MFTIRIRTKSTKTFSWNSSGPPRFSDNITSSLQGAVIEALTDFQTYVHGDGAQDGLHACLVTWEDGEELHAFLFPRDTEIPANPPWVLMRTQPERVTRSDAPRGAYR